MTQTPNYDLNLFDSNDDMEENSRLGLNDNADKIDTALKDIQDEVDGLSSPAAADVTYDNTDSGLTAENVQDAIDEELGKIDILSNSFETLAEYSTTEKVIGKWTDGKPLYRKVIPFDSVEMSTSATTNGNVVSLPANVSNCRIVGGEIHASGNTNYSYMLPTQYNTNGQTWLFVSYQYGSLRGSSTESAVRQSASGYVIIEYTKTTD